MKQKRIVSCMAALTVLCGCMPFVPAEEMPVFAAENAGIFASGECGGEDSHVTWKLDENGTLTISGTGGIKNEYMSDFYPTFYPWHYYANRIQKVVVEEGLEYLPPKAFAGCRNLKSVVLPSTLTHFWAGVSSVFAECSSLTEFMVSENHPDFSVADGVLYNKDMTELICFPCGKGGSFTVPDTVKKIPGGFDGCEKLTEIRLPDSFLIDDRISFWNCTSLKTVHLPGNISKLGHLVFYGCTNLKTVQLPEGLQSIGNGDFKNCTVLESLTIPDSVTSISGEAFEGCSDLTAFSVSKEHPSFSVIDGVLYNKEQTELICFPCGKGGKAVVPDSVKKISDDAFYSCENLAEIQLPDGLQEIGGAAFGRCSGLNAVTIPNSVSKIGSRVFDSCTGLKTVTIPESVTEIGRAAFQCCSSLKDVMIPDSVTAIGDYAFYGCSSLTGITIPDNVTAVDYGTFNRCTGLTTLHIGSNVEKISASFYDCTALEKISVSAENPYLCEEKGVLYNKDKTELLWCPSQKTGDLIVPEGVTKIGSLEGCTGITSLSVPASVKEIRNLSHCTNLTDIQVSSDNTVYHAENGVLFEGTKLICCPAGKEGVYSVPDGTTELKYPAFQGCDKLTEIILPDSLIDYSLYASLFYDCSSLRSISVSDTIISAIKYR